MYGRIFRDFALGNGEGVSGLADAGTFGGGLATQRAQRYYSEVGVHLEGERAWRSGAGEGEADGKGFQIT